ncbi:MAG: hypothetical protein R2705_01005 [Ilumatobacteraceae bacterium]
MLDTGVELDEMWRGKSLDAGGESGGKKVFQSTVTGIRGAQGGMYLFSTLGKYLPAAGGAPLAANPITLGIGLVFGGIGLSDDRKKKVATRRQAARSQVRQFTDDVQFEIGNQIGSLVKDIQRSLRDEFGDRLTELLRTYTDTATRAQQDGQRSEAERKQRIAEIDASLKTLTAIGKFLAQVPR